MDFGQFFTSGLKIGVNCAARVKHWMPISIRVEWISGITFASKTALNYAHFLLPPSISIKLQWWRRTWSQLFKICWACWHLFYELESASSNWMPNELDMLQNNWHFWNLPFWRTFAFPVTQPLHTTSFAPHWIIGSASFINFTWGSALFSAAVIHFYKLTPRLFGRK